MKLKRTHFLRWALGMLLGMLCGCSGGTYIPVAQQPTRRPVIGEIRAGSAQAVSGEQGSLDVSWELGTPPFRVVWTFSGGVEEKVFWDTVNTRSYTLPVIWSNPGGDPEAEFSCRVEVSDIGNGYGTRSFSFNVLPQAPAG